MSASFCTVATVAGPFSVLADGDGAVLASGWTGSSDALIALVAPPLRPSTATHRAELGPITTAVRAYHDGDLTAPDAIEVRQVAGEFLRQAWTVLRTVPPGKPVSYAELAALAGRPAAVRAAASACARNPAALFVPCHRVVRTGGGLGGFRWSLPTKQWLLAHESPT